MTGGSLIFLGVTLAFLAGTILTLFTRRGSAMNHHPYRHMNGGAPGADVPTEDYSGADRTTSHEREVVRRWREQDRPPLAPAAERAAERVKAQRPKPTNGLPVAPPI